MSDLFVDNIKHQSSQGSGTITIGTSGETVSLGTTAGGEISAAPAFLATLSGNQSIGQNTWTKIQCNSESLGFDTDNAYDKDTNYRFTVPTGKGGKYLFQTGITMNNQFAYAESALYVNGSEAYRGTSIREDTSTLNSSFLIDLDASDYVEVYCKQNQLSQNIEGSSSLRRTYFSGHRLIGV